MRRSRLPHLEGGREIPKVHFISGVSLSRFAPGDFFISRSDALLALAFFSFYFVWEDMVVGGFSYFEKEV